MEYDAVLGVENHAVLAFSKHLQSYTLQNAALPVEKKRCTNLIGGAVMGGGQKACVDCGGSSPAAAMC